MAASLGALFIMAGMLVQTYGGLIQFAQMIHNVVHRSALFNYAFYGCHCGAGGSGWPVDKIDWCCHVHDCCFEEIATQSCDPYWVFYRFRFRGGDITCLDRPLDRCARMACECDREAALCFKRHDSSYSHLNNYYKKRLLCTGLHPPCHISPETWH